MKRSLLIKTLFCLLVFASCKNGFSNEDKEYSFENIADDELVTPYTDMSSLENMRSVATPDPDIVDWRVARFFAVIEKIEFEDNYKSWKGAKISEKPIIIYYASSDKPRYYEFRVIKDNIEVGSITCNASKKEGKPIVYVSEMSHKVLGKVAKELASRYGNTHLSVVNYPNQFVVESNNISARSVEGLQREFKNARTNEFLDASKVFIEERTDVMLEKANAKTLEQLQITEDERLELLKEIRETQELDSEMWQDIDSAKDEIIAMTDEEIENRMHRQLNYENDISTKRIDYTEEGEDRRNILYDWYDKYDWTIDNSDGETLWCGPSAITLITAGLGKKAGWSKVPLSENSKQMRKMYDDFVGETGTGLGTGIVLLCQMDRALQKFTNYKIEKILFHRWQRVEDHITDYKLPVISLRTGWTGHYAGLHYRTIIGTAVDYKKEHHIFWWWWFGWKNKQWTKYSYNYWYCMRDAGVDSKAVKAENLVSGHNQKDFWELAGTYYQCRLALVKHK